MERPRRARTTARLIATVAAAGALLISCGGDDDAAPASPDAAADAPSSDEATAEPSTIVISGFAFSGPEQVSVGTTVVVRNDDSAPHTWTSVDDVFDSGTLAEGETFEFTFDEAGEFEFFCAFHPSMTGRVIVTG